MEKGNKKSWEYCNISHCRLLSYINDCNYIDYNFWKEGVYDF